MVYYDKNTRKNSSGEKITTMELKTKTSSESFSETIKRNLTDAVYIKQEAPDFRDSFYAELTKFYDSQKESVKKPWTREKIMNVIRHIISAKVSMEAGIKRTSAEYYWCSKYDVINIAGMDCLIFKKKTASSPTIRVIPLEEYYDVILETHLNSGHGGRDKIIHKAKERFSIARKAIDLFVHLCPVCESKRNTKRGSTSIIVSPLPTKNSFERGQFDLIDLQSTPDGQFQWLLSYQDHTTKFLQLKPLYSIQANEVASELLKIFLQFGAPKVLQSGGGREYTQEIIEDIAKLWPVCKIINGTPNLPLTHSVEQHNMEIMNMLQEWMQENSSTNWGTGCYFVQYSKNTSFHPVLGSSPYQILFGCEPRF